MIETAIRDITALAYPYGWLILGMSIIGILTILLGIYQLANRIRIVRFIKANSATDEGSE